MRSRLLKSLFLICLSFCSSCHAMERVDEPYSHEIQYLRCFRSTSPQGMVRNLKDLLVDNNDFAVIHENLQQAVSAAEAAHSEKSKPESSPSQKKNSSPLETPNFAASALTLFFGPSGEAALDEKDRRRDVYLTGYHVDLVLTNLKPQKDKKPTEQKQAEETSWCDPKKIALGLSGGREIASNRIFTFISSPQTWAKKTPDPINQDINNFEHWETLNHNERQKSEKYLYKSFLQYLHRQENDKRECMLPNSATRDSERYPSWVLNHEIILRDILEKNTPEGGLLTGVVYHMHSWLDMCRDCLDIQDKWAYLAQNRQDSATGFFSLLGNTLREKNQKVKVNYTSIVSSNNEYKTLDRRSCEPLNNPAMDGKGLWSFNVHQYMYHRKAATPSAAAAAASDEPDSVKGQLFQMEPVGAVNDKKDEISMLLSPPSQPLAAKPPADEPEFCGGVFWQSFFKSFGFPANFCLG